MVRFEEPIIDALKRDIFLQKRLTSIGAYSGGNGSNGRVSWLQPDKR